MRMRVSEAEKCRAMTVAQAAENRAKVEENRAKVVLAEAEVPKAIVGAFRAGNHRYHGRLTCVTLTATPPGMT